MPLNNEDLMIIDKNGVFHRRFMLVTKATGDSELPDILFETDIDGLRLQFMGGLDPVDIIGLNVMI